MEIYTSVGNYEIIEKIGVGGMGAVYKAKDTKLSRFVAIKIIHKNLFSSASMKRFRREMEISAQLDHPNIVHIYHVEEKGDMPFIVMEYIRGKSFLEYIQDNSIPLEKKLVLLQKAAYALHYAHKNNIVHRDVKPGNIMIRDDNEPVVMDFGIAKSTEVTDHSITKSGEVIGTPQYMSPEQAIGVRRYIDYKSDIYALGAILYHILTGHTVVEGDSFFQLIYSITEEKTVPISSWNPDVPKPLSDICYKAIEKDKDLRYASAKNFGDDLEKYLKKRRTSAHGFEGKKKLKNYTRYLAGLCILISLLFFAKWAGNIYNQRKIEQDIIPVPKTSKENIQEADFIGDSKTILKIASSIKPRFFSAEIDWIIGQAYYESKDFDNALLFLENLSGLPEKENQQRQFCLGMIFFEKEEFFKAQEKFQKLMQVPSSSLYPKSYLYFCICFLKNKTSLSKENLIFYAEILEKNRQSLEQEYSLLYKETLASLYLELFRKQGDSITVSKNSDIVLALMKQCIEEDPLNARYYQLLSEACFFKRNYEEASKNIHLAAQIQPSDINILADQWKYLSYFIDVKSNIFYQILQQLNYIFKPKIDIFEEHTRKLREHCNEICKKRKIPLEKLEKFYNNLFSNNLASQRITKDALLSVSPLHKVSEALEKKLLSEDDPKKQDILKDFLLEIKKEREKETKALCMKRLSNLTLHKKVPEIVLQYFEGETERKILQEIFEDTQGNFLEQFLPNLQGKNISEMKELWIFMRFLAIKVLAHSQNRFVREFLLTCLEKKYLSYDIITKVLFTKALKETDMIYWKQEHRKSLQENISDFFLKPEKRPDEFFKVLIAEILISSHTENINLLKNLFSQATLKEKLYILTLLKRDGNMPFYDELHDIIKQGYNSSNACTKALSLKNLDFFYFPSRLPRFEKKIIDYISDAMKDKDSLVQHTAIEMFIEFKAIFGKLDEKKQKIYVDILKELLNDKLYSLEVSRASLTALTIMGDSCVIDMLESKSSLISIAFFRGCSNVRDKSLEKSINFILPYIFRIQENKEKDPTMAGILFYFLCHYKLKIHQYINDQLKGSIDFYIDRISKEFMISQNPILFLWSVYAMTRLGKVPIYIDKKFYEKAIHSHDPYIQSLAWATLLCIASKEERYHGYIDQFDRWIEENSKKENFNKRMFYLAAIWGYQESIKSTMKEFMEIGDDILDKGYAHIEFLELSEIQRNASKPEILKKHLCCLNKILDCFIEIMPLQGKEEEKICADALFRLGLLYHRIENREELLKIFNIIEKFKIQDGRLKAFQAQIFKSQKKAALEILNFYPNPLDPNIVRIKAKVTGQEDLYWRQYYIAPYDPASIILLGRYYLEKKDYKTANEIFKEAIYLLPNRNLGIVYYFRAKICLEKKNLLQAGQELIASAITFYPFLRESLQEKEWESLDRGALCFEIASRFAVFSHSEESIFWLKEAKNYGFIIPAQLDQTEFEKFQSNRDFQKIWGELKGRK